MGGFGINFAAMMPAMNAMYQRWGQMADLGMNQANLMYQHMPQFLGQKLQMGRESLMAAQDARKAAKEKADREKRMMQIAEQEREWQKKEQRRLEQKADMEKRDYMNNVVAANQALHERYSRSGYGFTPYSSAVQAQQSWFSN